MARGRRGRGSRGRGCGSVLGLVLGLVLLLAACYGLVLRPRISRYVGEQLGTQLGDHQGQAAQALPGIVAALPPGEIVVTEQQANEFILAHQGDFGPVEVISLRLLPGVVQADLQTSGFQSQASLGLETRDGQVVAVNPQLSGPLAMAVSADEIVQPLARQLNEQLAAQGKRAQTVRVEQGRIVVVIE